MKKKKFLMPEQMLEKESIEEVKSLLKGFKDYLFSDEYISSLPKKSQKLIKEAKTKEIIMKRGDVTIMSGIACGPCSNEIARVEISFVDEKGDNVFVSAVYFDEVPDEIELMVTRGKSNWALEFDSFLTEEEKEKAIYFSEFGYGVDDDYDIANDLKEESLSTEEDWMNSKYAPYFLIALTNLYNAMLESVEKNRPNIEIGDYVSIFYTGILPFSQIIGNDDLIEQICEEIAFL